MICIALGDCLLGSTGHWPVPSGDSPDGMEGRLKPATTRSNLNICCRSAGRVAQRHSPERFGGYATHCRFEILPSCEPLSNSEKLEDSLR